MHQPGQNTYRKIRADRKVAVIGSGISGLSAAWLLSRSSQVTLFEADDRPGGHSNTADVVIGDHHIPVDTGFIVYNERNYPNLTALFSYLGVETQESEMSFSASLDNGAFEYGGSNFATMVAQKSNMLRFSFWRMLYDIFRFYRNAPVMAKSTAADELTLGDYLDSKGYSKRFVRDHILPMGAAIWSTTPEQMRAYPLAAFTRFFESHGLLTLADRPQWRTVKGGSRTYVTRMLEEISGSVRLGTPVVQILREKDGVKLSVSGGEEHFDAVVVATHGDQALRLLGDADPEEHGLLSAFRYTANDAYLHSDQNMMPDHRKVWSSWNYLERGAPGDTSLCVTYWMNRLQNIQEDIPLFVTLNPPERPALVHARYSYTHPLFDKAAIEAQRNLWRIQGKGNVWYAGAHFGSGFHEDGLQSGLAAAEAIAGVKRPWQVSDESGRIFLAPRDMVAG